MFHSYDYISLFAPFFDIPVSLGNLFKMYILAQHLTAQAAEMRTLSLSWRKAVEQSGNPHGPRGGLSWPTGQGARAGCELDREKKHQC